MESVTYGKRSAGRSTCKIASKFESIQKISEQRDKCKERERES